MSEGIRYLASRRKCYDAKRIVLVKALNEGTRRMFRQIKYREPDLFPLLAFTTRGTDARSFILADTSINNTSSIGPRVTRHSLNHLTLLHEQAASSSSVRRNFMQALMSLYV
jgi:hypothetical protein